MTHIKAGKAAAVARDYLPHLYGAVNWALVENVKQLPLKVSDIYRRLTT